MNDEFLHRLRTAPPSGFATRLKARLDRQSSIAASPKPSILIRSLVAAVLIGGTAYALTSVLVGRFPGIQALSFGDRTVGAMQTAAPRAAMPYRQSMERSTWRQAESGSEVSRTTPVTSAANRAAAAHPVDRPESAVANGSVSTSTRVHPPIVKSPLPHGSSVVATSASAYPYLVELKREFEARGRNDAVVVALERADNPGVSFCGRDATDVLIDFRRLSADELKRCTRNPRQILELRIASQAVILARSKIYGAVRLSPRDVFLALAKEIPDAANPGVLIENPHKTWSQVNPELPIESIEFVGPALNSIHSESLRGLVLEVGCQQFPWIAALKQSEPERYRGICHAILSDGVYGEMQEDFSFMQRLETYPTMVGIFSHAFFQQNEVKVGSLLRGPTPTRDTIAAESYIASRTLYLYAKGNHRGRRALIELLGSLLQRPEDFGFITHAEPERQALRTALVQL